MSITRKEFLKTSSAAALGLMLHRSASATPFDTDALLEPVPGNLPTADELSQWLTQLAGWCPPFTGSPGHNQFVGFLARQLLRASLTPERKTFTLPYWELKDFGLKVGDENIHATGYRPYSGPTSASGVRAPLHDAGTAPKLDFSGVAGKIVLMEMAPLAPPNPNVRRSDILGTYPAGTSVQKPRGALTLSAEISNLKPLEDAKAAGAICIWNGISDANAEDQALPFSGPPTRVPTLFVGHATGQRLKRLAASGTSITLTHHAFVYEDMPSDSLWATLPGRTDETIIINTHTDGCNANEENGALGVVALAQYFSKIPLAERQRTLIFLMTTGHFAHQYFRGTEDWRQTHQDVMKRTVACVTLEHLGAAEWIDDPVANTYAPSGQFEWGVAYTPLPADASVFLKAVDGTSAKRTYAMKADTYPGEGQGFHRAGIPCISYIPTPPYLFATPAKGGVLDKLNKDRFYGEVVAFAKCVAALDKMTMAEITG